MFTIDEKIDDARIVQFASQAKYITENVRNEFDRFFTGRNSVDFNQGLLAGYANSYVMMIKIDPDSEITKTTGLIIAYIAEKILQTKSTNN